MKSDFARSCGLFDIHLLYSLFLSKLNKHNCHIIRSVYLLLLLSSIIFSSFFSSEYYAVGWYACHFPPVLLFIWWILKMNGVFQGYGHFPCTTFVSRFFLWHFFKCVRITVNSIFLLFLFAIVFHFHLNQCKCIQINICSFISQKYGKCFTGNRVPYNLHVDSSKWWFATNGEKQFKNI